LLSSNILKKLPCSLKRDDVDSLLLESLTTLRTEGAVAPGFGPCHSGNGDNGRKSEQSGNGRRSAAANGRRTAEREYDERYTKESMKWVFRKWRHHRRNSLRDHPEQGIRPEVHVKRRKVRIRRSKSDESDTQRGGLKCSNPQ
jgi:hypothetical protein